MCVCAFFFVCIFECEVAEEEEKEEKEGIMSSVVRLDSERLRVCVFVTDD